MFCKLATPDGPIYFQTNIFVYHLFHLLSFFPLLFLLLEIYPELPTSCFTCHTHLESPPPPHSLLPRPFPVPCATSQAVRGMQSQSLGAISRYVIQCEYCILTLECTVNYPLLVQNLHRKPCLPKTHYTAVQNLRVLSLYLPTKTYLGACRKHR